MKNNMSDLNNYLFEQIERLNDEEVDIELEIKRADAVVKIGKTIIDNGNLALQARKHLTEYGSTLKIEIPLLGIGSDD